MRDDLRAVLENAGGRLAPRVVDAVEQSLLPQERVVAATIGRTRTADVVAVLSDQRIVVRGGDDADYPLNDLRGAVTYMSGRDTIFLALLESDVGEPFIVPAGSGVLFAETVRARVAGLRGPAAHGRALWDDPTFTAVLRLAACGLLAAPAGCGVETRVSLVATFTSVGCIFREKDGTGRQFLPWTVVEGVRVEGVDQVTSRPSVGAVVAFGVLGLAARRNEKRAFLTLVTEAGDYLVEDDEHLPVELRALLAPFLERLDIKVAEAGNDPTDPIEQIRRLGELRDAGYITPEQFEAKRTELLGRI
ncbi:MAG: hypothetical protein QOI55_2534 [Actinomycetota bacterium]|nr:hypothetical protein [Actinomycetota bacterium]